MTGQYSPGQRLTVRGVAAEIGTSVMPVREAFARMVSEGALEPLSTGAIRVPVFDAAKLQGLTEIRVMIEGLAARRAATRMTAADFEALERCDREVQRVVKSGNLAAETVANEQFHFVIYRAAQSAELLRIIEHLWLQVGPYLAWLIKQGEWPVTRGVFRHHKDIVSALRRRDGEQAEAALRADLTMAADLLQQKVNKLQLR